MQREQLALATKSSTSLLSPLERRLARAVVPRVPAWLGTQHLTMLTLAWCAGLVVFGRLAAEDPRWLWGSSLMIALQWVTDFFDGKVGKHRGTGLVKWGFYMDHLLDFAFLCAVLGGYAFVLPAASHAHLFLVLAVFGGFMVNSFLAFAATGRFHISHGKLGPTEFRLALVLVNSLLVFYGTRRMAKALPYVAACGFVALCVLAYRTQRELWQRDAEQRLRAGRAQPVALTRREAA
ncbi:MAG TPA: CDP-alcohol phosphatidyltransferase family protein [Pyrinomonadaceae bacterium]|jgi:phosphatidylglycerophosphate synthase